MKHKLIMENWRRFVNESENESGGLVDISAGPDVVLQAVPQLLADPELKNIVTSGRGDGDIPDEIIEKIHYFFQRFLP